MYVYALHYQVTSVVGDPTLSLTSMHVVLLTYIQAFAYNLKNPYKFDTLKTERSLFFNLEELSEFYLSGEFENMK